MTVINNDLYTPSTITNGIKVVCTDINLIESYHDTAIGHGMESLDHPAGVLIEQSLASKYPEHFRVGSGMEGISGLLGNLKVIAAKVKAALKNKSFSDFVANSTSAAQKAVEKQYASNYWSGYTPVDKSEVKPAGLTALVKGGSFSEVKAAVESYIADRETELKKAVDGVIAYWDGILPVFTKLQREENPDTIMELLGEVVEYAENTKIKDTTPDDLPKPSSGGTLAPLSLDDAKACAEYIKELLAHSKAIYSITEPGWVVGIKEHDDDCYLDNARDLPKDRSAPIKYIDSTMDMWVLMDDVSFYVEAIRGYMFNVIKGLEDWIEKSKA